MNKIIDELEREQMTRELPDFAPGLFIQFPAL